MLYVIEGLNRFRGSIVTYEPYHYEKPLYECSRYELYERLHISENFDDVIDAILDRVKAFMLRDDTSCYDQITWTGYCYSPALDQCFKCKEMNLNLPVTFAIVSSSTLSNIFGLDTFEILNCKMFAINPPRKGSLEDCPENEHKKTQITLIISERYLRRSTFEKMKLDVYNSLVHEFLHIREMYKSDGNVQGASIKGIEFEEIDQYNIDRSQQDEISIIVYYLNGGEIRARVNQFYSQLMNTSKDRLESIIDTEKCIEPRQKVIEVVNHFDDILQLGRVKKVILSYYENRLKKDDDLSKIDSDFFLYKLGYYCKKQGVFRIKTIEMSVLSRDEFVKSENRDKYVISSLNSLINLVEYATRLAATVAYDRLHEIGLC